MTQSLPIFFATPRSRSTALMTLASPFLESGLGLYPLGHQTEFFQEYSHRYFTDDVQLNRTNSMEYFPLNRENAPITHHFVYPPIYHNREQRTSHKLQVLHQEKKAGRHYNIKIMAEDIPINLDLDEKFDRSILDFFSNRTFVITRRRDIKGMALSLLVSMHTNLWHKRKSNESKYKDLELNTITINPGLCLSVLPSLKAAAMMDLFENHIQRSDYKSFTFYYEELVTVEDMKDALDMVFGHTSWQEYLNAYDIENSMPKPINLNYEKAIENYTEISDIIDSMIESIFG